MIEGPKSDQFPGTTSAFPFETLHEVNERCLELLVNAARAEGRPPFPLVPHLRDLLIDSRPEVRRRAAQRNFLLVDMELRDPEWWQAARLRPDKQWRTSAWRGSFPRRSAVPLARTTLVLAWHGIRADLDTSCVLLGMARPVAELIAGLQLSEIDRIAERRFRHIQPRWHDRPAVWRKLLQAAATTDPEPMRAFNLLGLQLMTGELLPAAT